MKRILQYLKVVGFVIMLLASSIGMTLPISMYYESRFFRKKSQIEQVDKKEENEEDKFELD